MNRRTLLAVLTALSVMVALPSSALADASAQAFIKQRQTELNTLLKGTKGAATDKKVEAVFDGMLDYRTLAQESLGNHWADRTDAEKKEFEEILQSLVRNAYRKNLQKTLDYEIQYTGHGAAKKGVVVRTVAKSRSNKREEPVGIDYVMHKVDGKWRVYDIVTEGSSLVRNYRSQFNRVIKKNGYADLVRRMKSKRDKGEA